MPLGQASARCTSRSFLEDDGTLINDSRQNALYNYRMMLRAPLPTVIGCKWRADTATYYGRFMFGGSSGGIKSDDFASLAIKETISKERGYTDRRVALCGSRVRTWTIYSGPQASRRLEEITRDQRIRYRPGRLCVQE